MYVILVFLLLVSVYTIINVLLIVIHNYKAHQFFRIRAPNLPVLPNPNIFSGHLYETTFQQKNYSAIEKLHEKYGPTFGFFKADQPWVLTKNIDLLKLIELDEPMKHINRAEFGGPFREFNNSIFQKRDDEWRRIRRAIAPALTNHKVRSEEVSAEIEAVLKQVADGIESRMVENDGQRSMILDVDDMFKRYTLALIFRIAYKRSNEINFHSQKDSWTDQFDKGARLIGSVLISYLIMFPFTRPLVEFLVQFHPTGRLSAKIVEFIVAAVDTNSVARQTHEKLQKRLSKTMGLPERPFSDLESTVGYRRRLVDTMIEALMEKRIKYDEFIGSLHFLLLAGFMTTADTITYLVWQLAWNPEIQEQLRASILKDGIDSEYLGWCIQETIRIHPAVPLGVGRVLGEDVTVNGMFLPKGAFIMSSTYSIHHDPSIWPEPEQFKPERWRDTSGYHPAAFMGFGLGPRNCVGAKLAVHEIKLLMRLLLTNYKIETCPESPLKYAFSSPGMIFTFPDELIKVKLVELTGKVRTGCVEPEDSIQ